MKSNSSTLVCCLWVFFFLAISCSLWDPRSQTREEPGPKQWKPSILIIRPPGNSLKICCLYTCIGVTSYKSLPSLMSQSFPMFSCKYIVLGFTFRYLIHSDLVSPYGASMLTFSGCSQHIPEATQSHLRKRFPYFPLLAFSYTHLSSPSQANTCP